MAVTIDGTTGIDKFGNTVIAGHQIGYDENFDGAWSQGTANYPDDDTIPQITEGTEFYTLVYTPKVIGSKLVIRSIMTTQLSVDNATAIGIYKSDVADALGMSWLHPRSTGGNNIVCEATFVTTSLLPITFSVRAGGVISGTVVINGLGLSRKFGGAFRSGLSVTEIAQ